MKASEVSLADDLEGIALKDQIRDDPLETAVLVLGVRNFATSLTSMPPNLDFHL